MSLPYTLIRSKRKTVALIVQPDGTLLVRAPLRLARRAIEEFISQKSAWILSHQQMAHAAPPTPPARQYRSGEVFTFLGNKYPLEIVPAASHTPVTPDASTRMPRGQVLELIGDKFRLSQAAQAHAADVFTDWYKQQARRVLEERVKWYATRFGLKYTRVHISSARTRWGSCSSRGSLSFTWRMVIAPLEVIDYVVAHELVHLRLKNHSPAFWREVESILPDYKVRQKWLKTNGKSLEI